MTDAGSPAYRAIERSAKHTAWLVPVLAIAPIAGLLLVGADAAWMWKGALAWLLSLAAKLPLMVLVGMATMRAPAWLQASVAGVGSAACELGIVLIVLASAASVPNATETILFATAAGSVEAIGVFLWSLAARPPADQVNRWLAEATTSRLVRHQFIVERTIAWLGQLGSRALITFAFVGTAPLLGVIAVTTFSATDGLVAWEERRGADWLRNDTLARYCRTAAWLVMIELAALSVWLLIVR